MPAIGGLQVVDTPWESISDKSPLSISGLSMDEVRRGHSVDALYRRAKANIVRLGIAVERVGKKGARPLEVTDLLKLLKCCKERLSGREGGELNFFKGELKYFANIPRGKIVIKDALLTRLREIAGLQEAAS